MIGENPAIPEPCHDRCPADRPGGFHRPDGLDRATARKGLLIGRPCG
jgi:hypothetical protein